MPDNQSPPLDPKVLAARITEYLSLGGLFNPEMANHDAVRDLLIDCRAALSSPEQGTEGVSEWERDPLGHAVRLLWVIETRYLAASTRERRKIALELQDAKEEVVSVAVQLEIEKAAALERAPRQEKGEEQLSEEIDALVARVRYDLCGDQMRAMIEADDATLRAVFRELLAGGHP